MNFLYPMRRVRGTSVVLGSGFPATRVYFLLTASMCRVVLGICLVYVGFSCPGVARDTYDISGRLEMGYPIPASGVQMPDLKWNTVQYSPGEFESPRDKHAFISSGSEPVSLTLTCPSDITVSCEESTLPQNTGTAIATDPCDPSPVISFYDYELTPPASGSEMRWVILPPAFSGGSCTSSTDCESGTICIGLQYTPDATGTLTSYTTGFFVNCFNGSNPILSNASCVMNDNSNQIDDCGGSGIILMNSSGNAGTIGVTKNVPVILHQVCLQLGSGGAILFDEDEATDLTTSIELQGGGLVTEIPAYTNFTADFDAYCNEPCPYPYVIYRKFVATSVCGNISTCTQQITIQDIVPPAITCPPDLTVSISMSTMPAFTGTATSTDNCDDMPVVSSMDHIIPDAVCPLNYLIERTWQSIDACGNLNSCLQSITVLEDIPPTISCPPDVTLQCTSSTSPMDLGTGIASDNCDPDPELTYNDIIPPGNCLGSYVIVRQWIAMDFSHNNDTCYQTITLVDTTKPVLVCPSDITITFPESTDPDDTGLATATDNCDNSPAVSYLDSIPEPCPAINFIKRTWYAEDACGNQSSCTQWIIILDDGIICGSVHDDLGQFIGGVQIELYADVNGNQMVDAGDTLVTSTSSSEADGAYCFTGIRPCQYVVVEVQPASYGDLSDYDTTPDPDGDDSPDGADNEIPVDLAQAENDFDNDFVDIICPTVLPVLPADTICDGQSIDVLIADQNLGTLTYSWDFGSGATPPTGMGIGTHTVSYVTTTQNQMEGASVALTISKAGCADLTGEVTHIEVNPYPNAAINTSVEPICYYTNKTFEPVAPVIPGATYNWSFGSNAVPLTANGYGPHVVYYTVSGMKTAKLVINPNQPGAECPDSSSISFTINHCPAQILGYVLTTTGLPINNVTIKLFADNDLDGLADNGVAIRNVTTNANGLYAMASLTPGSYVIKQTQPAGWLDVDDYDLTDDGDLVANISGLDNLIPVTLLANEVDSMNNFIESPQPGTITGSVFVDDNGDMLPNPGEGLVGVTVKLLHDINADGVADNNTPVDVQLTDEHGDFLFTSIAIGSYVLVEENPTGYLSIKDYDATNDGDLVTNTNMNNDTIPLTMSNNESDANNYFLDGLICPLTVTNTDDAGYASLRYIVDCAAEDDTIYFHPSLSGHTIWLTSGDIDISKNLVFISALAPRVTIGSNTIQLFTIHSPAVVEFKGLDMIGGDTSGPEGAAFENSGQLKLYNVNVMRNPAFPLVERLIRNQIGGSVFLSGTCMLEN